jgi:ADP-ribosylglycohydrolase
VKTQKEKVEQSDAEAPHPNAATAVRPSENPRAVRVEMKRPLHTQLRGCLLGGAIGDALGSPVEFMSLGEIRRQYGADGVTKLAPTASKEAEITDDTQMTLFTAEGILRSTTRHMEHAEDNKPQAAEWDGEHRPHSSVMWYAYRRWLHTQRGQRHAASLIDGLDTPGDPGWLVQVKDLHARRAPGNTCLSALRSSSEPAGSVERPLNDSKGCGGVMRVSPIGLIPCEDPFGYAVMAAALTHGHPSGYLPAGVYAEILAHLLFDQVPLSEAVSRAMGRLAKERGHEETSRALGRAIRLANQPGRATAERIEELGQGWTGEEALAIGLYCALVANSFEHGVCLAVNHSGDSDSTASIAGAILGLQCGEHGLPTEWLARLELREVIGAVADDLFIGYQDGDAWRERYPGS